MLLFEISKLKSSDEQLNFELVVTVEGDTIKSTEGHLNLIRVVLWTGAKGLTSAAGDVGFE